METAFCNLAAVGKLLNKAGHPDTYDSEALSLVRHAYKLCDRAGITLSDAITIRTDSRHYATLKSLPKRTFLNELADLEVVLTRREAEVARFILLLAEKTAEIDRLEAARDQDKAKSVKLEAAHVALVSAMAHRDAKLVQQASQIAEYHSRMAAITERLRDAEAQRELTKPQEVVHLGNRAVQNAAKTPTDASPPGRLGSSFEVAWTDRVKAKLSVLARELQ